MNALCLYFNVLFCHMLVLLHCYLVYLLTILLDYHLCSSSYYV